MEQSASISKPGSPSSPPPEMGRKVGFRPTLIIPPPAPLTPSPYSANLSTASGLTTGTSPQSFQRKPSFVFNDIRNFTMNTAKSGLGMGEKCSYWLYSKIYKLSRKWFTHCFLSIVLVLYSCGGAIMFMTIEGQNEERIVEGDLRKDRYNLIRDLRRLSLMLPDATSNGEWEGEADRKIESFQRRVIDVQQNKSVIFANKGDKIWTFANALVYCSTLTTTIGYGHIYPTTTTGRALTIVYSIIGIPLFLIALTDFGKLFTRGIKYVWSFVRRLYYTGSCRRARKTAHVQEIFKGAQMMYEIATFRRPSMYVDKNYPGGSPEEEPPTPAISNFEIDDEFNLPISIAILILILYIFLGALFYYIMEGWDFFASFYFVFISMSTIGFGDYVPKHPVCMIVSIVYLVFGLALMSMCINVVQLKLSDTFKQASAKLGATIGIVVEDDGSIATSAPTVIEIPEVHEVPNNIEKEKKNTELDLKTD